MRGSTDKSENWPDGSLIRNLMKEGEGVGEGCCAWGGEEGEEDEE